MAVVYCSQGHPNTSDNRFCAQCGEKLVPSEPGMAAIVRIAVGAVLGDRYQIRQELGHGGFGRTYLAEDIHRFKELCVLKEFAPQVQGAQALQKAKELFEREAGVLYRLQHPQIPRFRELFQTVVAGQGRLFLVQDYVEGKTYLQLLEARRSQGLLFTEEEVLQLLGQLLPVLQYIHSVGVIHRDISPDNLMLRYVDQLPVLIDFGGVKQVAAVAASVYQVPDLAPLPAVTRLGKIGYAPNEQMQQGTVFPHSDLYALAMTVLVLLTGQEPQEILSQPGGLGQRPIRHPLLGRALHRMLAIHPGDRFQSVAEVMQALGLELPAFDSTPTLPPNLAAPAVYDPARSGESASPYSPPYSPPYPPAPSPAYPPAYPATVQATSPINPRNPAWSGAQTRPPRRGGAGLGVALTLALLLGLGGAGWLTRDRWLPLVGSFGGSPGDGQTVDPGDAATANLPPEERQRKAELSDRRATLGVDAAFLTQITNDTFYRRHPAQKGRTLSLDPVDAEGRAQWDAIATEWLDQAEQHLSAEARQKLGRYGNSDRQAWKQAVNRLYVGSRSLNDLADARFFHLFPDWRGQTFIDQPIGQFWQAIAADTVSALQQGKTLERIRFGSGTFSQQASGTLNPGEGRVYIASLSEGQILRVNLQAPSEPVRFSIYWPRPTQQNPFILEDSNQFTWSGRLTQAGFYEFVIVSNGDTPVSYQLNLSVDNVTSTPVEPAKPEAPEAKN